MTTRSHSKTLAQTLAAIEALDLGPIRFKTTHPDDGYGWSSAHAERVEQAYRRYLTLVAKYPLLSIAPDRDIDSFWHTHILDTKKYAADCEAMFGHFLHHFPYLGLRGEEDAAAQIKASESTRELYLSEFGEAMPGAAAQGGTGIAAAWCGIEREAAPVGTAWCGIERGVQPVVAAWCGIERPVDNSPSVRPAERTSARVAPR
ncbi:MAG: hypothetical protein ABI702_14450 [Burkholderiales bacterium]